MSAPSVEMEHWIFDRLLLTVERAELDEESLNHFGFWFPHSTHHESRSDAILVAQKHCQWQIERYQRALERLTAPHQAAPTEPDAPHAEEGE